MPENDGIAIGGESLGSIFYTLSLLGTRILLIDAFGSYFREFSVSCLNDIILWEKLLNSSTHISLFHQDAALRLEKSKRFESKARSDKVAYHWIMVMNHRMNGSLCEENVFGEKSKHHKSNILLRKILSQEFCA